MLIQPDKKIGRWTILKEAEKRKYNKYFLCRCICGVKKVVARSSLSRGESKSCGCLMKEMIKKRKITHGQSQRGAITSIYRRWTNLKTRCENANSPDFKNYGGRGIKVLWTSFKEFYRDMGDPPNKKLTIDRINNDGHYCRENCRWATSTQQNNNRRPFKRNSL